MLAQAGIRAIVLDQLAGLPPPPKIEASFLLLIREGGHTGGVQIDQCRRLVPRQFSSKMMSVGAGLSQGLPNNASNKRLDGHTRCPLPADPAIRCRGQEWL